MKKKSNQPIYRFYGFGNYYLSSLQQGLQSAHTVAELFVQHKTKSKKHDQVTHWAKKDKTMVLLNGGNSLSLQNLYEFFKDLEKKGMPYAFAKFEEDGQSLNNALTYVGIVLPDDIYNIAFELRSGITTAELLKEAGFDVWRIELMEKLNQFQLAH